MHRWRGVQLDPLELPEGRFEMRSPRLSDGPAWSRARLANRKWLERAFPAWGGDWAAEQSPAAWVERWWQLRRAALAGRAMPFVLLLDGRLIGEIGIDAIDDLSNSGEASVWMVRDHGSAAVMGAASLLLIRHSFTTAKPIDRLISPVATAARKGRSPGLSAVGLRIEATTARKVGDRGMVDHDIWVVPNTAESRAHVEKLIAQWPAAGGEQSVTSSSAGPMIVPSARTAARLVHGGARRLSTTSPPARRSQSGEVILQPVVAHLRDPAGWRRDRSERRRAPRGWMVERVVRNDVPVGSVWLRADSGTAIHEIVASTDPGVEPALLRSALQLALAGVEPEMRAVVRVPCDPAGRRVPDDAMLRELGLTLVATFQGNPGGPRGWAGEQRWDLIA